MMRIGATVFTFIALAAACRDNGTAPQTPAPPPPPASPVSGAVVSLVTPNSNDGAMIVTLSGPDVSTIQAADSQYVLFSQTTGSEARVIVVGNLVAGPLFTIGLGTPHALSAYTGTIQQVATRGDSILGSTNGYQITLSSLP